MKKSKNVLFVEYCNATPHLETSLELAKLHLESGDRVFWYFFGHDVPYSDWIIPSCLFPPFMTPEQRGIRLIKKKNLKATFKMPRTTLQDEDILKKTKNIDDLIKLKWNNIDIGIGVANSFIAYFSGVPDSSDMLFYQELIKKMIYSYMLSFVATCNILKKDNFDFAYVFNGRLCCQHATANALRLFNIPVRYHERGANKKLYHVRSFIAGDRKAWQEDMLKSFHNQNDKEKIHAIGEKFFIENRNGVEQGWIAYNLKQKKNKLPDLPKEKKIISFFQSSDDEYIIRNKIFGNKPWGHQMDAFQALIEGILIYKEYHLVIRLHPHLCVKNKKDRKMWVNFPLPENCTLVEPESDVDSYSLIEASKMVFTYGSTIGVESIYWGTPSILLGDSYYDLLSSIIRVKSKEHLFDILKNGVAKPDRQEALIYGYYVKTFGTDYLHYHPDNLFSGKFMGRNLQNISAFMQLINKLWKFR